jgi:hypothetical protein
MLCRISCELAGCVHRPIVDIESNGSRQRPNQTLVSYILAGLAIARPAKLNFFFKLPPQGCKSADDLHSLIDSSANFAINK